MEAHKPFDGAPMTWRCFHCDESFTDREKAALHFGYSERQAPACKLDESYLRELEAEVARYREEDTDLHRMIAGQAARLHAARQRAEEEGYARGLRDAVEIEGGMAGHAPRGWWVGEMRAIFNAAAGDGITLDMKRAANIVLKIVGGEKFDANRAEWIMPGAQAVEACPDPVVEANRKLLLDRSRVGMEKYGVTLAGAGLPRGALLQHALEEALDLANYLQTIIQTEAKSSAARDVLAERRRQVKGEGWNIERDDEHRNDEISAFATYYAMPAAVREWPASETGYGSTWGRAIMPLNWVASHDGGRRRDLVRAGALILAEIERLDRSSQRGAADV